MSWDERIRCRHLHGAARKWTLHEENPKYAPDRTCDVEHLKIDLTVDLPAQRIEAVCTQRLRAAYGPIRSITLDAVDLLIHSVESSDGHEIPFTLTDRKLTVRFPDPVVDTCSIVIRYSVDHPVLGLYFHGPTPDHPSATWQMWSQGEDEEARYWIPCHDAPNEKMTTEMVVTVDERFTVISNGALLQERLNGNGSKTWHFLESIPHTTYLITLVIGEFVRLADEWRGIPVEYFVEPGREEEARRSFGKTARMMEFFSERFGCPYPYEKYAQVAIRHFHFGGMENTSATSQADATLHDRRAALNVSSDELVAHELVHQWFGDLLTCKSWAHAWLNEGFATYFEALWKEEDLGRSEFEYEMISNAAAYMAEPYRRPIVSNRYAFPHDLFDMHLYPKGGWVLHMLRRKLGDDLFWKAIRLYVRRHEKGCVETIDLIRALEDATGKNLEGFFDQWVMCPGHPEIEGAMTWDDDDRRVVVALKQIQAPDAGIPSAFHIPITVECMLPDGAVLRETFAMEQREQTFYLRVDKKPLWCVLDPDQGVLCTWKVERPFEWLEATLLGAHAHRSVGVRADAVRQAAEKPGHKAVNLLGTVLREDPFWGVQAQAAQTLGTIRTSRSFGFLAANLDVPNAKARAAVVAALGGFRSEEAAEVLVSLLERGDDSYFVLGSAAQSLGRTGQPNVLGEIRRAAATPSWHDVVTMMAASGLAATRDDGALDDLITIARDRKRYWNCRLTAMRAMAELGAARPAVARRAAEVLVEFLDDPDILVSSRVAGAIVALGEGVGVSALRQAASRTPDRRRAHEYLIAADELAGLRKRGEDIDQLKAEVEKLRSESKEMLDQLRRMEERLKPRARAGADTRRREATPARKPSAKAKERTGRAPAGSSAGSARVARRTSGGSKTRGSGARKPRRNTER